MKKTSLLVLLLAVLFLFAGCSGFLSAGSMLKVSADKEPTAVIEFEYKDNEEIVRRITLTYQLSYNSAPSTVANFIQLSQKNYYTNKVFHKVETGNATTTSPLYMAAGQYTLQDDGTYKEDTSVKYNIKGEFKANSWDKNELTYQLGSLVMYRDSGADTAFDTASASFFIALNDTYVRQGNYAVFGQIIYCKAEIADTEGKFAVYGEGEELVSWFVEEMISSTFISNKNTTTSSGTIAAPARPIKINKITIDDKGVNYSKAKIAKA